MGIPLPRTASYHEWRSGTGRSDRSHSIRRATRSDICPPRTEQSIRKPKHAEHEKYAGHESQLNGKGEQSPFFVVGILLC